MLTAFDARAEARPSALAPFVGSASGKIETGWLIDAGTNRRDIGRAQAFNLRPVDI